MDESAPSSAAAHFGAALLVAALYAAAMLALSGAGQMHWLQCGLS